MSTSRLTPAPISVHWKLYAPAAASTRLASNPSVRVIERTGSELGTENGTTGSLGSAPSRFRSFSTTSRSIRSIFSLNDLCRIAYLTKPRRKRLEK